MHSWPQLKCIPFTTHCAQGTCTAQIQHLYSAQGLEIARKIHQKHLPQGADFWHHTGVILQPAESPYGTPGVHVLLVVLDGSVVGFVMAASVVGCGT